MKIIHIITCLIRGGAEGQLVQMVLEQKKNGLNIEVIYLKENPYWLKTLKNNGINVHGPIFPDGNYLNFKGYKKLINILKNKTDILHSHMPPSLMVSVITSFILKNKLKLIFTTHNDTPFIKIPLIEFFFAKILLSKTHGIVALANTSKDYLIKNYNLKSSKIRVIKSCFDKKIFNLNFENNLEECNFYKDEYFYLGTIARLVPQKRIDLLLKSFYLLSNSRNNIKLVIIGKGYLKSKLKRFMKRLNLEDKVIWIDFTENVLQHLKKWQLFCLTSAHEGCPNVLFEAMYINLPILGMDVSSIKETIGPCGEVVPFNKCEQFKKKANYMLENRKSYIHPEFISEYMPYKNYISHKKLYTEIIKK